MDQPDPNAELLRRVKDGDTQALAELFSMYRDRLWRIINFRLDSRSVSYTHLTLPTTPYV